MAGCQRQDADDGNQKFPPMQADVVEQMNVL